MTPQLEAIPAQLGLDSTWEEKGGVHWLDPCNLSIRELARTMNALHARFITITAYQLPKETGLRLEYHWDLGGKLLGFGYNLTGNTFESIYDLTEAVDWIEREIHEGFAIEFTGREYEPLLMRAGDAMGVNLREEVKK
ncbi:MAG: NADH-quinone oxidoreductase subunit C [Terracidiphilus sp.]